MATTVHDSKDANPPLTESLTLMHGVNSTKYLCLKLEPNFKEWCEDLLTGVFSKDCSGIFKPCN